MKNRTAMLVLAGAVVFASSIGAVAGCLSVNSGDGGISAGSTPSPSAEAGLGTPEATPTVTEVHESPSATPKKTRTTATTRPPTHDDGPRIAWFRIKQRPQCPQGTSEYPVEGVPVILEWKVTGADQVTISVDGPGVYGTYSTEGSETFAFSCGGAADGETVKHTYLLKTVGGGSARSKQLTATATAHEITQV